MHRAPPGDKSVRECVGLKKKKKTALDGAESEMMAFAILSLSLQGGQDHEGALYLRLAAKPPPFLPNLTPHRLFCRKTLGS